VFFIYIIRKLKLANLIIRVYILDNRILNVFITKNKRQCVTCYGTGRNTRCRITLITQLRISYTRIVTDRKLRLKHEGKQVIIRESKITEQRTREI